MSNTIKNNDISEHLVSEVQQAYNTKTALKITAGQSKQFYGRHITAKVLDVSRHTGVIQYHPSELVITVRAGTSISELTALLNDNNQMLAFEPPDFELHSTIGGTIACGLSGSRRPFAGSARDAILGTTIINGKGERCRFGGEVIKNVAGYDVSRLITGSLGTLGVLLDISMKVIPKPELESTLVQNISVNAALKLMTHLKRQAYPISGLAYLAPNLYIRLSGSELSINKFNKIIGGEFLNDKAINFSWQQLNNHSLSFFNSKTPLWRVSVKSISPELDINGLCLYDWAAAQRWILSDDSHEKIYNIAKNLNGHATQFRHGDRENDVFQQLSPEIFQLHKNLKTAFDPDNILNPRILYKNL